MKFLHYLITFCVIRFCMLSATEFTVSSYNCGGLSDHYDYLRAASMGKLMQERYSAEPENMSTNEKIQKLAIKILFSTDSAEKASAQQEWDKKKYQKLFERLTAAPTDKGSLNKGWNAKAGEMITFYNVRPVVIRDIKVNQMLDQHLADLVKADEGDRSESLQAARKLMAMRTFDNHLNFDIICLQEADYLDSSMFPDNYESLFAKSAHSKNGIAWNKVRFDLVKPIGNIVGRAFAVQLRDKKTDKTILIASAHFTGCNPYRIEKMASTGMSDSAKGDREIQAVIELLNSQEADMKIIGMDSNVTALHPRLHLLKDAGYQVDYENYLEPTCTNSYQVLNTRIDWIALKSKLKNAYLTNIPVLGVGLNCIQTNMSDHKPIAAKVYY